MAINDSDISAEEYEFNKRLREETFLLQQWFIDQRFSNDPLEAGAEIEFFLLEQNLRPAPHNLEFIKSVNEKFLIPEVGAAHLEINSNHFALTQNCLSLFHQNILSSWRKCCEIAQKNNYHVALIGSLPTATTEYHHLKYITRKRRYSLINSCMKKHNAGHPISVELNGFEQLTIHPQSLAINGLLSAFQLHLQVPLKNSVKFYNCAQAIAGPLIAISCNSPFIFEHHVWNESRIFIFDEVMTLYHFNQKKHFKCCLFGTHYLKESFFELFQQNYEYYPRLIPEVSETSVVEEMFHAKRQNGVIYRWNRPVIDFDQKGQPHLRIEHRGPSSGPTVVDMIANAAFFYGLINYYGSQATTIENILPFKLARRNFFNAARYGLKANFHWEGKKINAITLLKHLIPKATEGLKLLEIKTKDCEFYLGIIKKRIETQTNGSHWQCQFIDKYGKDFPAMMAVYLENQYSEKPISEWSL